MDDNSSVDRGTVGLSENSHAMLKTLADEHFSEMTHGYRFAIALALAMGSSGHDFDGEKRRTFINVGTLDRDHALKQLILLLYDCEESEAYGVAERLAEWGVREMARRDEAGELDFASLIEEAGTAGASSAEVDANAAD